MGEDRNAGGKHRVAVVHLSDFHIDSRMRASQQTIDSIATAVENNVKPADVCFLVVSGDIANSGQEEEYEVAFDFLEGLNKAISSVLGGIELYHILVPGNHDCNLRGGPSGVRQASIAAVQNDVHIRVDDSIISVCLEVQDAFFELATCLTAFEDTPLNRLFFRQQFDVEGVTIAFDCYNTAWMSVVNERKGTLRFPLEVIVDEPANVDLSIAVLHHPYSWMEEICEKHITARLGEWSQVVLTGHRHDPDEGSMTKRSGEITDYVQGGNLDVSRAKPGDSFNILLFDVEPRCAPQKKSLKLDWAARDGVFEVTEVTNWTPLTATTSTQRYRFRISEEFEKTLSDPGLLEYVTGERSCPKLERFAILPDLIQKSRAKSVISRSNIRVRADQIMPTLLKAQLCWITGETLSGKSTFLRVLFKRLHRHGHYPLLLDGEKMTRGAAVEREIKRAIRQQYKGADLTAFLNQPHHEKVVLVDDMPVLRRSALVDVVNELKQRFGITIIMTDDIGTASGLFVGTLPDLEGFKYYRLGKLGRRARSKLLRGWLETTTADSVPDSQITERLIEIERTVTALVKNHSVPSYPIFVLTAAQQAGLPQTTTLSLGSLGKLFQALMTLALAELDIERFSSLDTYLAAMAFHIAYKEIDIMDKEEINRFNSCFNRTFGYSPAASWISDLESSSILRRSSQGVCFTFPYAQNFYMSRYVEKYLLSSEELSKPVHKLVERYLSQIGDTRADTALMFIYSVCKNENLVTRLLERADDFTGNWSEIDLERDTTFINRSVRAPDDLISLPDVAPEETRQRMLESEDEIDFGVETTKRGSEPPDGEEDKGGELIEGAFSSLGILGQFLKSFASELPHDKKVHLMRQAFSIALRIIWKALSTFSQDVEAMLEDDDAIEKLRERYRVETPEEVVTQCQKIAFGIAWFLVYILLKGTSSCLGARVLQRQTEETALSMELDSAKLLMIVIGLDHFRAIPERLIRELAGSFSRNTFAYRLLRLLAYEHLLLYGNQRTPRRVRDRLKTTFRIRRLPPPILDESA